MSLRESKHKQRLPVFVTFLLFCLVLVLIQLWLFVSALEEAISGRFGAAVPAMITSFVCLAINWWMLQGVYRMEKLD